MHGNSRGALLCAFLLAALFLPAASAHAQGSRKQDIVVNRFGQPVAGATVTVCTAGATGTPCSPLAAIYSNVALTTVQANPFTTDGLGNYSFYAAPGRYQIQFSGAGLTATTIPDVILPCDPSNCNFNSISVTNGISAFSLTLSGNLSVSGTVTTGVLNPASISTTQTGTAPAQIGPHWYPGTATGLCSAPAYAPNVAVDGTIFGTLGTTTYYYKITYFNRNGETTASPTTTFAAGGANSAIYVRPNQNLDLGYRSGCYGYRTYVSSDNVNFYLQTPYTNVVGLTGHYIPGDAIFKTYTFSGATPPVTNTAAIDALQVALNATANYPANSTNGQVVIPQGTTTLTTPLVVTNQQKLIGAASLRASSGTASLITSAWTDPQLATVMVMGIANAWSMDGVVISGSGNALMLMGNGAGSFNQNGAIHNSSVVTTSTSNTYCALTMQGVYYNFDSDNVYYSGDKAVFCPNYVSGGTWKFKGSRWDDFVSAIVAASGPTDRDRLINYPSFPNGGDVTLEQMFTESGTGIVFDMGNVSLRLVNFFTADSASVPGTAAVIRMGCDTNCTSHRGLQLYDSQLGGSTNYTQQILITGNNTGAFPGITLFNSSIRGNINLNSLNIATYVYGLSDLCLDPACNAADGGQILNRAVASNNIYAFNAKGARDGSGAPDYISILGRYLVQYPADNWAKRRRWFFDTATDNVYCNNPPGADTTTAAAAQFCLDNTNAAYFLGNLSFAGGYATNRIMLTGAPTALRTVTSPDASYTIAGLQIANIFSATQTVPAMATSTNCAANSVSPAACGSAASGAFVVPTTTATYTVNTSAVTATSRILLTPRTYAGDLPSSPTCVAPAVSIEPAVSAISAGASFTIAIASTTGQTCWNYWIVN
jgi:hypothetical protein